MFWNLGQWCGTNVRKCPLPAQLEKFKSYIDYNVDEYHEPLDLNERPQPYNSFINSIKELGAHIFLNCEAGSLFPFRGDLQSGGWHTCFNGYTDLMCAARLGRGASIKQIAGPSANEGDTRERYISWAIFEIIFGETVSRDTSDVEPLTRAQMHMCRVCIYHVSQHRVSSSASMTGEGIAVKTWECMRYQVDILAGDGNKACYLATPGIGKKCVPSYQQSLLQFWTDRMVKVAASYRRRYYRDQDACPVRVKHFISASFDDLTELAVKLAFIKTDTCTDELAKATGGLGDCCMMSVFEWGHSRWELFEDINDYQDEDHRDEVGEFSFQVNEMCLHNDHNLFLIGEKDTTLFLYTLNPQ